MNKLSPKTRSELRKIAESMREKLTEDHSARVGDELLQFRDTANNLTQVQLAERIGSSPGTIRRWENGTHSPPLNKVLLLFEIYGLGGVVLPDEQTMPTPVRSGFQHQQQNYLEDHPDLFEMWFFNAEWVPMLRSGLLENTWAENIRFGVNYNVVWHLHSLGHTPESTSDFWLFVEKVIDIIELEVSAIETSPKMRNGKVNGKPIDQLSGIDVFGLTFRDRNVRGVELFEQALNHERVKSLGHRLRFHPVIGFGDFVDRSEAGEPAFRDDLIDFFWDASIGKSTTVAYLPNDPLATGKARVEIEPVQARRGFTDDNYRDDTHHFFGPSLERRMCKGVELFMEWFVNTQQQQLTNNDTKGTK